MYDSDNVEYAVMRLVDTIITYQGRAVVVQAVHVEKRGGPLIITSVTLLNKGNEPEIIVDEISNYNLVPVDLGFVNFGVDDNQREPHLILSSYYVRNPMRNDWRQGLRRAQCSRTWGEVDQWDAQAVARTIEGKYFSLDEVLDFPKKFLPKSVVAWSHDFACDAVGSIFYRGYGRVGNFINGTKDFLLDQKFFWVEESLKEAV